MEKLLSKRLELRPIEVDDKFEIYSYRSDPDIYKYQAWKPKSADDVAEFITTRIVREPDIPNTWLQLAICLQNSGQLIGDCGIHFLDNEPEQVEIGITLNKQSQGMGYAAEALTLIFDYVFRKLHKHRIIASVDPANSASIKLMEKMKMRQEAHFVKSMFVDGEWIDDVIFAILADEWLSNGLPTISSRH